MNSIKQYLFISLLFSMTLVMSISGIYAYRSSTHEIDELFDSQLAQYTRIIAGYDDNEGGHSNISKNTSRIVGHPYESKISFQVFDEDYHKLGGSENIGSIPLVKFVEGYHDVIQSNGKVWKVFVLHDNISHRWYMASESLDIRGELVSEILKAAFAPLIFGFLISFFLIRGILSRGLSPMNTIGDAITNRPIWDFSPLKFDKIPAEVRILVDDINSLLSRVKKSMDRERRFSADAAHELKTPLASLKLHLANLAIASGTNTTLDKAQHSCNDIQRLIEQLLAFNRLEPQYFSKALDSVLINPVCRQVLADEAEFALAKNQEIRFESLYEGLRLHTDVAVLQMLVRNIVHNAIIYTPEGGFVHLRTYSDNKHVFIEVLDNGPGIPESEREHVFDRFYRLDGDSHSSGVAGSGLGLAIVREIVELHGGVICLLDGTEGRGLCVRISFPL